MASKITLKNNIGAEFSITHNDNEGAVSLTSKQLKQDKGTISNGTSFQLRRGTASENNVFTGAAGEITVDTTQNRLRVHDGITAGGHEIPTINDIVKVVDDQNISGIKTFNSFPITPSNKPVSDYQVSNKKYVDDAVVVKDFLAKVKSNQVPANALFGGKKGISVLGDSITHGAFALNSFNHSWGRLFQKMANVDLQSKSYGVINFLSLGSGGTATTDIHSVNFTGSWSGSVNGFETLMGAALSNNSVGDEINITIPSFQNNGNLNYIQSPTGGTFELYINGVLHSTTDTSGTLDPYAFVAFPVTDNGKGFCSIKIKVTVGTCEISTIQYYKGATALVNLFATSGRKLREVTDSTIELVCANSSTLVMALGHNDTYTAELVSRIDKLITECNANDIALVIPDFRWNLGTDDLVRQELLRLHNSVSGSIYIPFPELFKNDGTTVDGTYTVTTLGLFKDASHPNQAGHKIIAETIAKEMKFSVTSKEEANYVYNFVMPLALNTGTTVNNVAIVSSVKWDKSNLTVNCLIRMSPTGAFPIGTHTIQTAWNSKYEVPLIRQNWQGVAYIRNDTGAIVSVASLNSAGELKLYVLSSFVTNQQFEFSVSVQ